MDFGKSQNKVRTITTQTLCLKNTGPVETLKASNLALHPYFF